MFCEKRVRRRKKGENRKTGKIKENRHSSQLLGCSDVKLQDECKVTGQRAGLVVRLLKTLAHPGPSSQVGHRVSRPLRGWISNTGAASTVL